MSPPSRYGALQLGAALAFVLIGLAGCSSQKPAIYEHENFDDSGTFSRNYPVSDTASCEAARRALLSQGYIITSNDPKLVSGHKSFQQTGETHLEISFNVVCAADATDQGSTMFANALQDRYALKKVNNSASLGVGVLGSVSMPIGSTDDSMVKVASETVASDKFYDRYFSLVESFLPAEVKKAAHIPEKPKNDLGVPEAAPAALAPASQSIQPTQPVQPAAQDPAQALPEVSEPMAPPAEPAPIETLPLEPVPIESAPLVPAPAETPAPAAEPAAPTETVTPVP